VETAAMAGVSTRSSAAWDASDMDVAISTGPAEVTPTAVPPGRGGAMAFVDAALRSWCVDTAAATPTHADAIA
jgi:hypothetical protein